MARTVLALFGNVGMIRTDCAICHRSALVQEGRTLCCEAVADEVPQHVKRETSPEAVRRLPPKREREAQLLEQEHRCFYCDRRFGTTVFRAGQAVSLRLAWDHVVPYVYTQNNYGRNFVAACHLCNGMKSDRVFQTIEEARIHVATRWEAKGITDEMPIVRTDLPT